MAVRGINYDGGYDDKPIKYKNVNISYRKGKKVFKSGNFIKDWYESTKFLLDEIVGKEPTSMSSSVNHFIMDGAPYDSAYLHFLGEEETPTLLYWNGKKHNFLNDSYIFDKGIEMFVNKGEKPTWIELQEYCTKVPV